MLSFFKKNLQPHRTPSFLQVEHSECGVVALAIVFGFYKKWIPVEQLRESCGVSRDGSNALNLLKCGEAEGFETHGYSLEVEDLEKFRTFPMILHWKFNHFVVLEKIGKGKYFINDPANGRIVVGKQEFAESFTGIVLTFKPAENFEPEGYEPSLLKSLKSYVSEIKIGLVLAILLGFCMVIPGALIPIFSMIFIDHILVDGFHEWLPLLLAGIGVVSVLQFLLNYLQQNVCLVFQTRLAIALNSRLLVKSMKLPLSFFTQRSASEVAGRAQLVDSLCALVSGPMCQIFTGFVTACVYFAIMLYFDWMLCLVVLCLALINLVFFAWQVGSVREVNQNITRESSLNLGEQLQALQLLPEAKVSGLEDTFLSQILGRKARWLNSCNKLTVKRSIMESMPTFLKAGSYAVVLLFGGLAVVEGRMSIGVLVAFQGLMMQFLNPIQQMLEYFADMQETQGNIDRIEDILAQPDESQNENKQETKRLAQINYPILEIKDLTFGYSPMDEPMLDDFNLLLKPGKWVAFVGESGSGKSTIVRLLSQLYKPWSGQITIEGVPLEDLEKGQLSSLISFVDQKITLFNGTVSENLSLWNTSYGQDELVKACKISQIHEWIINQPSGYDHKISENGSNLSGGEKARIEIARSLVKEPTLTVLDEATAALDVETENKLLNALKDNCAGGIIVSHRIEPIISCDEIVVFEKGKIVQRGNHQQLLADKNGTYASLFGLEQA